MKLSEELRKGSAGCTQIFGAFGIGTHVCAVGAIARAQADYRGNFQAPLINWRSSSWVRSVWEYVSENEFPVWWTRPHSEVQIWDVLVNGNDQYHKSFDELATWLEGIGA